MVKQTSVRLDEDNQHYIESKESDTTTATDIINGLLRIARKNLENSIETTTEVRIPFSEDMDIKVAELKKVLETVNKELGTVWCEEWERLYSKNEKRQNPWLPSQLPCLKNPDHHCEAYDHTLKWQRERGAHEYTGEEYCILLAHKDWRELLHRHLCNVSETH